MFKFGLHPAVRREKHQTFHLSPPLLRTEGGVFHALLVSLLLRPARPSNLHRELLLAISLHPFSSSSGTASLQKPFTSICSDGGSNGETRKKFDANAVSAICRSVISRCSHAWEKKDKALPEVSSLLDFVKLSIRLSPQTMRRFWRVSALRPEEVLEILTGIGPRVGRKEAILLLKLFIWSGKQAADFHHLPKSYEMMISMLIGARMFSEAESLLVEALACEPLVPGFNGFFSEVIQGYVEICDLNGSVALFDRARCRSDVVLTVTCCQVFLRWLVELEKADLAHRIYMDMVDMGLVSVSENFALNFIVCMLCKNGKTLDAVSLLRRIRHLGIESVRASLDAIVDAYCKKRDFEDLLNLLKEWQHLPGIHLCNKIISCICRTWGTDQAWLFMQKMEILGFVADAKTFEIFICWSSRVGQLRNSFIYLSEMFSRMLWPNVQVYNALLSRVFKEGMWKYAKEVYADMVEKGIVPDTSTFRVILAGFCREKKFDEVTLVLEEMVNRGFFSPSPSEDPFSKAFSLLGLDCMRVSVKRDNNLLFPKAEFFDSLGNGLYLDTDLPMYEGTLIKILDDAIFPEFDSAIQEECRKGEMETALMMTKEAVQYGQSLSVLTYSLLLKGMVTSDSFIEDVSCVVEEIPELCNYLDHQILNLLLQVFSKNRILAKEKHILDLLCKKELPLQADTCSTIIMAFCKRGDLNGFLGFWNGPQRSSWMPGIKDIKFVLNCLLKWELFKEAFELFEFMLLKYPHLFPAICNAFVKEFCAADFTIISYAFVCEALERDIELENSSYEYLVTRLCTEKRVTEAFHVLDVMFEKNVTPSTSLCRLLVHMLFRSSRLKLDELFMHIKWSEESEVLFSFHGAVLDELYRIVRNVKAGPKLRKLQFEGLLPFHNILDIIMQTYCQEKNFRKICELLCFVTKMHLQLSMSTYVELVRLTCSIGRVHDGLRLKDIVVREYNFSSLTLYNIMIYNLLQEGNSSSVDVVLNDMKRHSCSPDQDSFNFLIHGYYMCGNAEKSVELLKTMISKNLQPNNRSLRTAICYLCSHLRLSEALELSQTMEDKGWKYGTVILTILVQSLLSHGKLQEAEQFLGRLQDKDLIAAKACHDVLIKCFCRIRRISIATNLLNLMLKKGNLPSETSYNFVLQGFVICNAIDEALNIHAEILHNKLQPCLESYGMLIYRLCGDGRADDAESLLNVIMAHGQVPSSSMFRAVFDRYHSENNLSKTSELLEQMWRHGILPDFEIHWSLISNLNSVNNEDMDNCGKGFLTNLLSQTGFPAKDSKPIGGNTVEKSIFLP